MVATRTDPPSTADLADFDETAFVAGNYLRRDGAGNVVGTAGVATVETYTHVQDAAATVWTIDHPLAKRPAVVVTDSAGTLVQGRVEYASNSRVVLRFSVAFSGRADLN